jgi:hydrogenase maturation protease
MNGTRRPPPILLFAYGNPSRGDDALGPALLDRLPPSRWPQVERLTDFQLQIEHALDLPGRQLVLLVDASLSAPPPFTFHRVHPAVDVGYTTHSMSPEQLLNVFRQMTGDAPPPTFVLAIRGYAFELGEPPSPAAQANLSAAVDLVQALMDGPNLGAWTRRAAQSYRADAAVGAEPLS